MPNCKADNFDEQHANHERTLNATEQEEIQSKKLLLRRDSIQHLFNGYYYDYPMELRGKDSKVQKSDTADKSTAGQTNKTTETKGSNFLSMMTNRELPKLKKNNIKQKPVPMKPTDQLGGKKKKQTHSEIQTVSAEDAPLINKAARASLTSDIQKIENEEFNNIIGVYNRKKSKNDASNLSRS